MSVEQGVIILLPQSDAPSNEQGEGVVEVAEFDCEITAGVGDLVRLDLNTQNKVLVAEDNLLSNPVIGRILRKTTSTHCVVVIRGVVTSPILPIGKVFLSDAGTYTDVPPPDNYLQTLGYSFGNGKIHLEPNLNVVYRAPA